MGFGEFKGGAAAADGEQVSEFARGMGGEVPESADDEGYQKQLSQTHDAKFLDFRWAAPGDGLRAEKRA